MHDFQQIHHLKSAEMSIIFRCNRCEKFRIFSQNSSYYSNLSCLIYLRLIVLIAALVATLLAAKVEHVLHANIVPADLAFTLGACMLTVAIVVLLVGKMLFEAFFDGPVALVPIEKWILVLNLQDMS